MEMSEIPRDIKDVGDVNALIQGRPHYLVCGQGLSWNERIIPTHQAAQTHELMISIALELFFNPFCSLGEPAHSEKEKHKYQRAQ